jgi:hypothetical protein
MQPQPAAVRLNSAGKEALFEYMTMHDSRIIGIVLVRNEDLFIELALNNILEFCDSIIVADNCSTDSTSTILQRLAAKHRKIDYHLIDEISISHELIKDYAGKKVWIFGVDGDEIYDPAGLTALREEMLAGKYEQSWMIFGNVLNCLELDRKKKVARGYLAPPCRSMTKLYNFNAIDSWETSSGERLHGGAVTFKDGYDGSMRLALHEMVPWEEATFRCLHMCFLQRSSLQKMSQGKFLPRPNPADIMSRTVVQRAAAMVKGWLGIPDRGKEEWKIEKFTRGDLAEKDVSSFFHLENGPNA